MFVLDVWSDGTDADAHGSNEDEGILPFPFLAYIRALNAFGTELSLQHGGNLASGLTNLNDGYLLHRSIVIGW